MTQVFHRSFNTISRVTIFGSLFILAGIGWFLTALYRSYYVTGAHIAWAQPVPFSHQHHVGDLGIDCRYCHTSVETSSFAGIPPTKTCMNCHQEMWVGSSLLAPVRDSYRTGQSIPWVRVHNLPEFVYFDHSVHIHQGIGCYSCHGRVDQMPLMLQQNSLLMEWCLDCHRDPAQHIRPREQVFSMAWSAEDQGKLGPELVKEYGVQSLTSCSVCHR